MPRKFLAAFFAILAATIVNVTSGVTSGVISAKAETLLEKIESPYNTIFVYDQPPYITLAFGHKNRRYIESRRNPMT